MRSSAAPFQLVRWLSAVLAAGPRTNAVKIGEEQIITQSGAGVWADGYGGAGMGWHGLAGAASYISILATAGGR